MRLHPLALAALLLAVAASGCISRLLPAATTSASVGPSGGASHLAEEWEGGLAAWSVTGSGASQDCALARSGSCSLRLEPTDGTGTTVAHGLAVPLRGGAAVAWWFQGSRTDGDTDLDVSLALDAGQVVLQLTDGVQPNTGVTLTSGGASTGAFAHWSRPDTWYQARVLLDGAAGTASAQLRDAAGTLLAGSPSEPLPAGATRLAGVSFHAASWSSLRGVLHVDGVTAP